MEKRKIEVYIDGSSVDVNAKVKVLPKPEPEWHGSYAGVFLEDGVEVLRMKGYEKGGTIGKMELMALVASISKCSENGWSDAVIHLDSQYVVNGYNSWLKGWVKKGFAKIKFPDKWEYLWGKKNDADSKDIKVTWVKGHHECAGNHIADKLANEALGAGITGWKVSGKERFLLFDKVEGFMKSHITGDMLPIHYIQDGTTKTFSVKEEIDVSQMVQSGQMKLSDAMELMHNKSDDNDFTDMAKKKSNTIPNGFPKSVTVEEARYSVMPESERRKDWSVIKKPEKVYPTWYEEQIAKHKELIKKQTEEFNQMMDRYAKHVEEIIYELKIEKEKQDGTRSTKSNP